MDSPKYVVCFCVRNEQQEVRPSWVIFHRKEDAYNFRDGLLHKDDIPVIAVAQVEYEKAANFSLVDA